MFCRAWMLLGLVFIGAALAAEPVAVLYPAVKEPFHTVFTQVITGVQAQLGEKNVLVQELDDSFADTASVDSWIATRKPSGLILLGGRGYKLAHELSGDLPAVVGAVPFAPNGVAGVSLASDPKVVFDYLQRMAPNARSVFVVHTAKQRWIIARAQDAARNLDIHLQTAEVTDVMQAAQEYKRMIAELGDKGALWLLADDVTVSDDSLMSYILESAWDRRFVLFSSTPAHVKRGALFSFIPNNEAMGRHLAKLLIDLRQTKEADRVLPVSDLRLAVNTRTASHLGLALSADLQRDIVLTFPVP